MTVDGNVIDYQYGDYLAERKVYRLAAGMHYLYGDEQMSWILDTGSSGRRERTTSGEVPSSMASFARPPFLKVLRAFVR